MNSYKDLIVWQKAFLLAKEIYKLTGLFPRDELYGLTNQLRRASVSIVSNIAEGFTRRSIKERQQFFWIAYGSTSEIESQLMLAKELGFAPEYKFTDIENLLIEVRKILIKMLNNIKLRA